MTTALTDRETHIEHDLWHIDLALWLGKPSPALMGAMGVPLTPTDQGLADLEEDAVMALQRYAKAAGVGLPRGDRPAAT